MNSDLFIKRLGHFQKYVKSTVDDPVIPILDNDTSRCSLQAITFCREHFIALLSLPPHATYKIQPLDRGFFDPLKTAFSQECTKWMLYNPGIPVTLKQFGALFHLAYSKVSTIQICEKSFVATALFPYNPDIFAKVDFAPSEVTNIPNEDYQQNSDKDDDLPLSLLKIIYQNKPVELLTQQHHTQPQPSTSKFSEGRQGT
ncbi:dde superfamily endonuclease [Holotrichia oblita]|uniref:Dde superfamily endonuclease n=1 Tax=Holotrichia oblita TaxID=644536 RepID=A0ACB9T9R4_HOLOL|nr:dde superfamily endonuclease [Holotrichia oblita]